MARVIHVDDALKPGTQVAVLYSYKECPEEPGVVVRYTSISSAALITAYIFRAPKRTKPVRSAIRLLSMEASDAYRRERAQLNLGCGI